VSDVRPVSTGGRPTALVSLQGRQASVDKGSGVNEKHTSLER